MTRNAIQSLMRGVAGIQMAIDRFWAGVWWLELRQMLQVHRLGVELEASGERSHSTRKVTKRLHWFEKSKRYWRASPPLVLAALEASERAGVPIEDLRLLALNRDVRQVGNTVKVRRCWWMPVLAYCLLIVVTFQWTLLTGLVVLVISPWVAKIVGVGITTLIYWALWPGFGLYTTRAYAAVKRSGAAVERVAMNLSADSAEVTSINDWKAHR